jgi:flagellar biosynthesis protein FliP
MDGFSEDEIVVVVDVSAALRLEAVPSNRTNTILAIFMTIFCLRF